ncbi:similar to Saccharomyces cerevisiae YPR089W Protein of unknown function [Maudiozyma barnettii]|uniref:Dilute domain-containing protein n=1 Tax=Maudiozyma barnettii TaxID=61262 RepID=A0A8H2VB76_9SACH|nr:hypothetical protein [Kazachstania barnettii]CAB4252063.1 similar to Saccharomyces cerevisiae YPR089W Protein of unknown function [Kazachstania barnettii]CAD1778543.1 similar to Saccharomyces cerevisiae YPR089W Protein of unknown function [Kazachstania barnettii]
MNDNVWGNASISNQTVDSYTFKETSEASTLDGEKLSLIKDSLKKCPSLDDPKIKQLQVPWIELVQLITDETRDEEFRTFEQILQNVKDVNDLSLTGVALIHYIIAYDRPNYIELLQQSSQSSPTKTNLNLNCTDGICGYTPLMWAFVLERKNCTIELFNFSDQIDFTYHQQGTGYTAWDMITPGSLMYDFLNENNMLQYNDKQSTTENDNDVAGLNSDKNKSHDAIDNIDLKIAGMGIGLSAGGTSSTNMNEGFSNRHDSSDMYGTEYKNDQMNTYEHFDFNKLVKYQYFEFSDYDIPQILDFLTSLPIEHQHMTTYPAALLFQCIRYADRKRQSPQLVQSLVSLSFTRIIASVANEKPNNNNNNNNKSKKGLYNHENGDQKEENSTLSNSVPLSQQDSTFHDNTQPENNNNKSDPVSKGDIVTQSYWIGSLTFLYYYLSKDESFFKRYPAIMQELINTMHSIMIELTVSIHSRLSPLIEPTLINYTTIKDVEQTLYKKDWNFFKKRRQAKLLKREKMKKLEQQQKERHSLEVPENGDLNEDRRASNDNNGLSHTSSRVSNNDSIIFDSEVLKHLLPPSLQEQMKPSPVKIIQIFGALSYVLNLHQVHPLFQQQCLSLTTSWFSTSLFNMILKDRKKKTLSRARAIQIRLNLSSLESWIKNNDLLVQRPKLIDDFMWERFPYTLVQELNTIDMTNPVLKSVTTYKPVNGFTESTIITDMSNSLFYYQRFHKIAQWHLEPIFELLQWLQIATTLDSEESLENTKDLLPKLSNSQLVKAIDKYHYEVNEHKFNSKLKKALTNEIKRQGLTDKVYLDENQIPLLTLPTVPELTDAYANEYEYLPLLPNDIQDVMYDIHDENYKMRLNDDGIANNLSEEKDTTDTDKENIDRNIDNNDEQNNDTDYTFTSNKEGDDNIFKELDVPSATVSRPVWATNDDIDGNPW